MAKVVDLDPILEELGNFGKFQLTSYALMLAPIIFNAFFTTSYIFTAAEDSHRCLIDECESINSTTYNPGWFNKTVWTDDSQCKRHARNTNDTNTECDADELTNHLVECTEYVYKDKLSIVSEFNLGCTTWKRTLVGTINNIGQLVCLPLTGFISDKWGRKSALVIGIILSAIVGIIKSFSPNYYIFILLEFLDPALGSGVYSSAFILAVELVGPKYRVAGGTFVASYYTVGEVLLGIAAYYIPYWRYLLRLIYAPALLLISYFWLVPESVRWLLAKGKSKSAEQILQGAAIKNGITLSTKSTENLYYNISLQDLKNEGRITEKSETTDEIRHESIKDALKSPKLLFRVACCSWMWITCTLLFYGISLSSVSLAGNIYLNFILVSLVEIPSFPITIAALIYCGRRPVLSFSYLLGGAACLAFAIVPEALHWMKLVLFLLGKFAISISFTVLYVYTTEIFPTSLRHSLLATCSMVGRFGSIIAPQAPLLANILEGLPYIVFGISAVIAGALVLTFPETKDKQLTDTIEESLNMDAIRTINKQEAIC